MALAAFPAVVGHQEVVVTGKPLLAVMDPCSLCRNLSSASQQTRQKMRECHGLVDSMIHYVNSSLEVGKSEDKVSPGICSGYVQAYWAQQGAAGVGVIGVTLAVDPSRDPPYDCALGAVPTLRALQD